MKDISGWFSDVNDEYEPEPGKFQPYYQMEYMGVTCLPFWFDTEEECDDFIDWFVLKMNMRKV